MRRVWEAVLPAVWATLAATALASVMVWAAGVSALEFYALLFSGTWGNGYGIGQVLFKSTPLIFTGLAVSIGLRAGFFNIGAEGQITVGAFAAAWVGAHLPESCPSVLAWPICAAAAFFAGGLMGGLLGWLKAERGAHEVINSIMLNFIVSAAMVGVGSVVFAKETVHTHPIVAAAAMPRLGQWFAVFSGSAFNVSFFVALATAAGLAWMLFRTRTGFELRTLGQSVTAAQAAGVPVVRTTILALALSGGVAALGGINFVLGYKHYYEDGFSGGVGFWGIAVAVLARNHPLAVVVTAIVFGTLSQGALVVNAVVPKEIVDVLQAVMILLVAAFVPEVRRLLLASYPRETSRGVT